MFLIVFANTYLFLIFFAIDFARWKGVGLGIIQPLRDALFGDILTTPHRHIHTYIHTHKQPPAEVILSYEKTLRP